MATYRTSQIAARCGIHPNTVRLYEEQGLIPPVPRAGNGYRMYSELHLEHVHLVRTAFRSTWLGGAIRQKALLVLHLAASGSYNDAIRVAGDHLGLVREEREKAELAACYLENWATVSDGRASPANRCFKTKEIAERLDITRDMLRSWERNSLLTVPRDPVSGYRRYGSTEVQRLYVIRALRKARFSLMSIHHMFQQYDRGVRENLTRILDELPPYEEDIFYQTNQWLTKICGIEESARELISILYRIERLSDHAVQNHMVAGDNKFKSALRD